MQSRRMHNALLVILAMSALGHPALAQSVSSNDLATRTLERRAVEAAIWGMPIVSVDTMRQAFFRDAKAKYGDIVYWSQPSDWKFQFTTPNASTRYVYFNFNTKDGPVVLELPKAVGAGLFGSIVSGWEVPLADVGPEGEDKGQGGKYLLLPPGTTRRSRTATSRFGWRPTTGTRCFVRFRRPPPPPT